MCANEGCSASKHCASVFYCVLVCWLLNRYCSLVCSQELKSSVRRRYRDFEAFSELLLVIYPYRLVPRMPPKKLMSSK